MTSVAATWGEHVQARGCSWAPVRLQGRHEAAPRQVVCPTQRCGFMTLRVAGFL